jgi:hypothetical protein
MKPLALSLVAAALASGCGVTKHTTTSGHPRTTPPPVTAEQIAAFCDTHHISPCSATISGAEVRAEQLVRQRVVVGAKPLTTKQKAEALHVVHALSKAWTAATPAEKDGITGQAEALCDKYHLPCKWKVVAVGPNGEVIDSRSAQW